MLDVWWYMKAVNMYIESFRLDFLRLLTINHMIFREWETLSIAPHVKTCYHGNGTQNWKKADLPASSHCELLWVCMRSFKTSSNIADMSAVHCFATPNTAPRPINVIFEFKAWKCNDYRVFPVDTSLPSDSYIVWLQHWAWWPRQCASQK